jgi:hypothetical protein
MRRKGCDDLCLFKVFSREGASGTRLQIFLEPRGDVFGSKFNYNMQFPRPVARCIRQMTFVMCDETVCNIGCEADVMPALMARTLQNIHEALT